MADSARPVRHALGGLVALAPVAAVVAVGCGATETDAAPGTIGTDGVSIELPAGWDGYATREGAAAVIRAASVPLPRSSTDLPLHDGVAIEIRAQASEGDAASWIRLSPPLSLADGFLPEAANPEQREGRLWQIIQARVGGRALLVEVFAGRAPPDDDVRAQVNGVLSSLTVPPAPVREQREGDFVLFDDPEVGVSGRYPAGWHRAQAIAKIASPREVLVLATYPLRERAKAGECAPDTARADLPPGGAFVWLLEYRPVRGEAWADVRRENFPAVPDRFELTRADLGGDNFCFPGRTYRTTFRAADRPLQLLVAFGGEPSDERLAEVSEILTSLRFQEVPPPPPDPYAGWAGLHDNPGDSFQAPPGWAAAAALFPPDTTPRRRTLFFASNRPLFGLPDRLVVRGVAELPPSPSWPVANEFPADGVLVWVREERKGGASPEFPAIGRDWPSREDFRPVQIFTEPNPDVRWLRAGGAWMGFRFSVLVGHGPDASEADLALALKSGQSLAVSGCWRDGFDDCPDE